MNIKYLLQYGKKLMLTALLFCTYYIFAQNNPALEMSAPATTPVVGAVSSYTATLSKNTNNPSGNTFATYSTPSPLTVGFSVTQSQFAGAINFGDATFPPYTLMTSIGNVNAAAPYTTDNNQYTSFGVANTTGIDIEANYGIRGNMNLATAGTQAGNGRIKFGEITITFSRPVNNPIIHFKALGGNSGSSFSGEFTVKSVINSSNADIRASTTLTGLSGTYLNINNTTKTIDNDYTGTDNPATVNSGRGSVRFTGNNMTTIVLEAYVNRNGTATAIAWTGTETFILATSIGESDLQVTNTVNQSTSAPGSTRTFTITATNNGASNNTGVTVLDLLPSGYTYVSHTASTGVSTYVPGTGVWTIGNLNDAGSATLTITATVNATGNYANTAVISTSSGIADPNTVNNSASASINIDTDGDTIPNNIDLDDDNDGILDTVEGCSNVGTVTMGSIGATEISNLISTNTALFPITGVPLTQAGVRVTKTSGGNGWQSFTPANSSATVTVNGTTSSSFPSTYLDLIDTGTTAGVARNLTIDFGQPANSMNTQNTTYQYIIGIAGLGAEGQLISNTFSVPLTVASNFNVNNNNVYSTFNGVTPPVSGAVGTVFSTNSAAATTAQGYTYFLVPANVAAFTMSLVGANDRHGIIFGVFSTSCNADTDGDGTPNYLDLDSDNDGCPDVIEGGANFVTGASYITGNRLNTAVNASGVPAVPTATPAITGYTQAAGQTVGQSQNGSRNDCVDSDGDGIADWQDLDDDNDGILDSVECPPIYASYANTTITGAAATTGTVSNITWGSLTGTLTRVHNGTTSQEGININSDNLSNPAIFTPAGSATQPVLREGITTFNNTANFTRYTLTLSQPVESITLHVTNFDYMRTRFVGSHQEQLLSGGTELVYDLATRQLYDTDPSTVTVPTRDGYGSIRITSVNGTPITQIVFDRFDEPNSSSITDGFYYTFSVESTCDNDGDGIPNRLDLDSDGDGCPDVIEGGANFQSGATYITGNRLNTTVNTVGIPGVPVGTTDYTQTAGQTVGQSQDANKNDCLDTDADGVPNWIDLDDDNDGILDLVECPNNYLVRPIVTSSVTTTGTLGAGNIQTIADAEGAGIGTGSGGTPGWYVNVTNLPLAVNMNMQAASTIDNIKLHGPWGNTEWIKDFRVELYDSGNVLLGTENLIAPDQYSTTSTQTVTLPFSKEYTNVTRVRFTVFSGQGYNIVTPQRASLLELALLDLQICDTDGDGIPNTLDLDSDGDGCSDAFEGAADIAINQLVTAGGTATGGSTSVNQNLCATGACVNANGIPQFSTLPTGYSNTAGQALGTSQNSLSNPCYCYKTPVTVAGNPVPVKHGITALRRAGSTSTEWPGVRQSAWTVLESKSKGFVVNRLTTAQITAITLPVEGMMVYDTDANCLKIYNGTVWNCFTSQTCPD